MTPTRHPLIDDYLSRLRAEAGRLDPGDAQELLSDIEAHLSDSVPPDASEAQVREALDRIGQPHELVDAALGPDAPMRALPAPTGGSGTREAAAIFTLIAAEVIAIFWFFAVPLWIVGVVCLATATKWTSQLKLRGFLGLASGMPIAWMLLLVAGVPTSRCSSSSGPAVPSGTPGDTSAQEITTTCTSSVPQWTGYVVVALLVAYLVYQVLTVRKLARAARG